MGNWNNLKDTLENVNIPSTSRVLRGGFTRVMRSEEDVGYPSMYSRLARSDFSRQMRNQDFLSRLYRSGSFDRVMRSPRYADYINRHIKSSGGLTRMMKRSSENNFISKLVQGEGLTRMMRSNNNGLSSLAQGEGLTRMMRSDNDFLSGIGSKPRFFLLSRSESKLDLPLDPEDDDTHVHEMNEERELYPTITPEDVEDMPGKRSFDRRERDFSRTMRSDPDNEMDVEAPIKRPFDRTLRDFSRTMRSDPTDEETTEIAEKKSFDRTLRDFSRMMRSEENPGLFSRVTKSNNFSRMMRSEGKNSYLSRLARSVVGGEYHRLMRSDPLGVYRLTDTGYIKDTGAVLSSFIMADHMQKKIHQDEQFYNQLQAALKDLL